MSAEPLDKDFADVRCPHCESAELVLVSLFGSSVSEVMFRCLACRTFFNWIKWRGKLPPIAAEGAGDAEALAAGGGGTRH